MKLKPTSLERALLILGAAPLGGLAFSIAIALCGVNRGLEPTEPDRTLTLPYARAGA